MAVIKEIVAEQVLRTLAGGDVPPNFPIKRADIYLVMDQAYNYICEKNLNQFGDIFTDEYASVYVRDIETTTARNLKYITLPGQFVTLRDGRGIRQISPIDDDYNVFIPIRGGSNGIYNGLEASPVEGFPYYWVENGSYLGSNNPVVYFKNVAPTVTQVLLKMITSVSSLGDTDTIQMPASAEPEYLALIIELLGKQKQIPKDSINDNNTMS
jgi:hypothetical protein